jgi:hypothetical protein
MEVEMEVGGDDGKGWREVGGRISDFRECWKLNHQAK